MLEGVSLDGGNEEKTKLHLIRNQPVKSQNVPRNYNGKPKSSGEDSLVGFKYPQPSHV